GPGSPGAAAGPGLTTPAPGPAPVSQPTPTPVPPVAPQALDFDAEFARRMGMSLGQAQALLPLGYQAYQRQLQAQPSAQANPAAQQPANPFGLPEFDYRLLDMVQRDASGNIVPVPGAPPDAVY